MELKKSEEMNLLAEKAQSCIDAHVKQAVAISFVPLVSLPFVYGVCAKMILKLDRIYGIPTAKGWESEILHDVLAGIVAAPALAIPILGAGVAAAYIRSIGEHYSQAVSEVVGTSAAHELEDGKIMTNRVKDELQKIHTRNREKRIEHRLKQTRS